MSGTKKHRNLDRTRRHAIIHSLLDLNPLQPAEWIPLRRIKILLEAEELFDALHIVEQCSPSLHANAPCDDRHIFWNAHRCNHLWAEDTTVPNLNPLLQSWMKAEDLHRRLGIRIVGWLEAELGEPNPGEEVLQHANQMSKADVPICNEPLHLVKLRQVCLVECLVSEDAIDREVLLGSEYPCLLIVLAQFVQGSRGDGCRVGAEDRLSGLVFAPRITPADGAAATLLVHLLHGVEVIHGQVLCPARVLHKESVMRVASRMLLWLEEGVEVPERALHPLVGAHLFETHEHQDISNLRLHLLEWVQMAAAGMQAASVVEIKALELGASPSTLLDHLGCDLCNCLGGIHGELCRLLNLVGREAGGSNHLPLLKGIQLVLGQSPQRK
mmetsp:Transcript_85571/g.223285  ORF Transcript_85571/g.223285 Transcript_85571/m.223285 type:complete len:384 (-) Transcript_85571:461-1612(-)